MSVEYCAVTTMFSNKDKRVIYMRSHLVPLHIKNRLDVGGITSVVVRAVSQAQYIRHTTRE